MRLFFVSRYACVRSKHTRVYPSAGARAHVLWIDAAPRRVVVFGVVVGVVGVLGMLGVLGAVVARSYSKRRPAGPSLPASRAP